MNGTPLDAAQPVSWFHSLLGEPARIIPAGPPAPAGHRNNQIHYYDNLGLTLNEHHYTFQIQSVTIVLDTADAIHPTRRAFSGRLEIGGIRVVSGASEGVLAGSKLPFASQFPGTWFATVLSAPVNGRPITVAVDSAGRKLASGRRSKRRRILTVAICLEHDPWDTQFRH